MTIRRLFSVLMIVVLSWCPAGCEDGDDGASSNGDGTVSGGVSIYGMTGSFSTGGTAVLNVRFVNSNDYNVKGYTNGLRVYSPDGGTWGSVSADSTGVLGRGDFDLLYLINYYSVTGSAADTVSFNAAVMNQTVGMPEGFDDIVYTLAIGPIPAGNSGKRVCVDSSWFRPSGTWLWAGESEQGGVPGWGGPYCYTVQ